MVAHNSNICLLSKGWQQPGEFNFGICQCLKKVSPWLHSMVDLSLVDIQTLLIYLKKHLVPLIISFTNLIPDLLHQQTSLFYPSATYIVYTFKRILHWFLFKLVKRLRRSTKKKLPAAFVVGCRKLFHQEQEAFDHLLLPSSVTLTKPEIDTKVS